MEWLSSLLNTLDPSTAHLVNDSKTPSGRAHVGALRGVILHDAIYRALGNRGTSVRYTYGVDDFDPLDELPAGRSEEFSAYLGQPLCMVPPPAGSKHSDMAEHYFSDFFSTFEATGVKVETYRMRDIYRDGTFDDAIARILDHADDVRRIYKEVSGAEKGADWFPFQTVCENCGRIGTTRVTGFDGREVIYSCEPSMVKWATGCGHIGKRSPFGGGGKLPWKLEWIAKWKVFGITIEGAGQDHSTRGGSRDVSDACMRAVFGSPPPINVPYGFFLVDGAKMSSSKGVGVSAADMVELLPPEIIRFLMLRSPPARPVNFSGSQENLVKLFNDFDRTHAEADGSKVSEFASNLSALCEVTGQHYEFSLNYQTAVALVQLSHIDPHLDAQKRKGSPLTPGEVDALIRRLKSASTWLSKYALPEDRFELQQHLPKGATDHLSWRQRGFLRVLAEALESAPWTEADLQQCVFDSARLTPIGPEGAYQAIYRVVLNGSRGPRAGGLLGFLEREWVLRRFYEIPFSRTAFWNETTEDIEDLALYVDSVNDEIAAAELNLKMFACEQELPPKGDSGWLMSGVGVLEFRFIFRNGKCHVRRNVFHRFRGVAVDFENERQNFLSEYPEYITIIRQRLGERLQVGRYVFEREVITSI